MRFVWLRTGLIIGMTLSCGVGAARADNVAASLAAIADTADRICGIIAEKGEAGSASAQIDIHAELNGLAKRLATLGGGVGGQIATSEYKGLLQQALPQTLASVRDCKLQVLKILQAALLLGVTPIAGHQAHETELNTLKETVAKLRKLNTQLQKHEDQIHKATTATPPVARTEANPPSIVLDKQSEWVLLLIYRKYGNELGDPSNKPPDRFDSVPGLSKKMELSESRIQYCLDKLISNGLVTTETGNSAVVPNAIYVTTTKGRAYAVQHKFDGRELNSLSRFFNPE